MPDNPTPEGLREILAEALAAADSRDPVTENAFPNNPAVSDWSVMMADTAMAVFRKWLESEAGQDFTADISKSFWCACDECTTLRENTLKALAANLDERNGR